MHEDDEATKRKRLEGILLGCLLVWLLGTLVTVWVDLWIWEALQ